MVGQEHAQFLPRYHEILNGIFLLLLSNCEEHLVHYWEMVHGDAVGEFKRQVIATVMGGGACTWSYLIGCGVCAVTLLISTIFMHCLLTFLLN